LAVDPAFVGQPHERRAREEEEEDQDGEGSGECVHEVSIVLP
jgi:hypothetical protein